MLWAVQPSLNWSPQLAVLGYITCLACSQFVCTCSDVMATDAAQRAAAVTLTQDTVGVQMTATTTVSHVARRVQRQRVDVGKAAVPPPLPSKAPLSELLGIQRQHMDMLGALIGGKQCDGMGCRRCAERLPQGEASGEMWLGGRWSQPRCAPLGRA